MVTEFHGKGVVKGIVTADVILIPHSFSFLGDVEMNLGTILTGENKGITLKDKILVFTESKGSSGGCVVLLTLVKKQLAPAGIDRENARLQFSGRSYSIQYTFPGEYQS